MSIENGTKGESEKKKKEISEKKLKLGLKKQAEFKKVKEKIIVELKAEDEIFHLKELVEKGVITKETAKKIQLGEHIDEKIIKEIFKKIDEIEDIKNIDQYIPKELRINHEEYSRALHDDIFRLQIITKLDSALTILANQITPDASMGINLFTGFLTVLDKNLVLIQENTIDVRESLKEIDEKKFGKVKKNGFFNFIKEFFS